MTTMLSQNSQAILLLTAPLIIGRSQESADLLSPGEYKRLAKHLLSLKRTPADLLSGDASAVLEDCRHCVEVERLERLLSRGFLLSQAMERWQARAIWVVSRADPNYPKLFKIRLREDAPAVVYGCGDIGLLDGGGLAVVGSRHVDELLADSFGEMAVSASGDDVNQLVPNQGLSAKVALEASAMSPSEEGCSSPAAHDDIQLTAERMHGDRVAVLATRAQRRRRTARLRMPWVFHRHRPRRGWDAW